MQEIIERRPHYVFARLRKFTPKHRVNLTHNRIPTRHITEAIVADEHDDWMGGLGVDIGALRQAASGAASSVVSAVEDTASTVVQAVSDAPPPVMQAAPAAAASEAQGAGDAEAPTLPTAAIASMPAPSSAPGLLEEAEEAVVSGVRAVVRAAPEVVEATETAVEVGVVATVAPGLALGAIAVGGAAFAATMLWSNTSIPAWEGKKNPDTGQDFTSQEEYDRYQASLRDKRKNAQPLPPPVPGVDYDDPDRQPNASCDSMFPGIPKCSDCQGSRFENIDDAEANEPTIAKVGRIVTDTMDAYKNHPDGKNNHRTYYDKDDNKLFSLVKTPCCSENPQGPTLTWYWSSAD